MSKRILNADGEKDHWKFHATADEFHDILVGYYDLSKKIDSLKQERDDKYGLAYLRLQQRCSQRKLYAERQALSTNKGESDE